MSAKNTMTRDAMLFLPAKVAEGLLVIVCSSLYTYIFTKPAVTAFNLTNTTMQLIYLVLAGWMANSSTRYIGEQSRLDGGRALFSTVSTIYLLLCLLVGGGCLLGASLTRDPLLLGGALMFCTYTAFQILNAALIQLGRIRASIVLSLASASLKLAVAYALVGGQTSYPLPYPAVTAAVVADGVAAIGAALALGLPTLVRLRFFSRTLLVQFLKFGVPLLGVSIAVALLNQIDKYLVVGFYGDILYAYYSQNNAIASGLFTMLSVGVMRGVYPNVLRAWREGGKAAAKPLLDQGVRLYLLIAVPAVAGLAAVSLPLSRFLFAPGYEAGAPVIAYTALAMLFMGLTEYANKAYELEQSTIHMLQNSALSAVIKVISSVVLLRAFGFTGGAMGSVAAFASYFVLTCVRVRRRFLFRVAPLTLLRIVCAALLCGAAAYGCTLLPLPDLLRLALAVVTGVIVYAVCIVVSGEGRAEMQAIRARLHR
ncbi:MAG: polysaccharide biosynthesis C-terminal domain-containing protein [Eubacteriales bacterium]|nr:polysaccharide biosynthesis C-terminal domain-containing protein [Eubacteriales bacterium]